MYIHILEISQFGLFSDKLHSNNTPLYNHWSCYDSILYVLYVGIEYVGNMLILKKGAGMYTYTVTHIRLNL